MKIPFLKAIQAAFQNKKENQKLVKDFKARGNYSSTKGKGVKELIKGHTNFIPKEHQIQTTGRSKIEDNSKVEHNCELPWDVLEIIFKKLEIDDFLQFAGVCKDWRAFHKISWTNFLTSQEPLLLQFTWDCHKRFFSFISIPSQKVYSLTMKHHNISYVMFSRGYFIMKKPNDSFLLINPFTTTKKVINAPPSKFQAHVLVKCVLLAFDKCSEEFVLVVLGCDGLYVYQSRNRCWVSYSTKGNLEYGRVVDAVVLHNIIYVVTNRANIGVLNLNSSNIIYLKLKSTSNIISRHLRLVNCDEQLLVIDFMMNDLSPMRIKNVYKIDFSTMNYVKLKTLGDIALFYAWSWNGFEIGKCYALSNPNWWGYENNSMYVINKGSTICSVYTWDDKKLQKCITLPPTPCRTRFGMHEWCFRHIRHEIDYSLVE